MKKTRIIAMLLAVLIVFAAVSCKEEPVHEHSFTKEIAEEKYLATPATEDAAATYYKSCECGEKGEETFSYGEPLEHTHKWSTEWVSDENKHWHECECGEKKDVAEHDFKVAETAATCTTEGVKTYTCKVCDETKSEKLPPLGHSIDETGKCTRCDATGLKAAKVGETEYTTLKEAIDAAESGATITLLCDASGDGIGLYKNPKNGQTATKNITIDFNNHTYTIDGDLQGSTGTVTQAFHLEKDCTVILKNGKLTSKKAKMLIQNYCNLTLDGMVLDFVESGFGYALSNNCGEVQIKDTTIKVAEGKIAFDSCKFASYSIPTVTISGASEIDGKIELSGGKLVCPEVFKDKISYYSDFEEKYKEAVESGVLTIEPLS